MSAVAIEQPTIQRRIFDELLWRHDGLRFSELREILGLDSGILHSVLCQMWSEDVVRRIPGERGECRYVLTRVRHDVPGKSQYVAATQRAAHSRAAASLTPPMAVDPAGDAQPVKQRDVWDDVNDTVLKIVEVLTSESDRLVNGADLMLAEAHRHTKLANALTEWTTA